MSESGTRKLLYMSDTYCGATINGVEVEWVERTMWRQMRDNVLLTSKPDQTIDLGGEYKDGDAIPINRGVRCID